MTLRNWLWFGVALAAALWLAGEGEADTEGEGGWGSGSLCERNVTFFLNVTVTNDGSAPQRHRILIYGAGVPTPEPNTAVYDLLPGESAVLRAMAEVPGGDFVHGYMNTNINIDERITAYGTDEGPSVDRSSSFPFQIPQCGRPVAEALTPELEGRVGEELALRFRLTNRGNWIDDIVISLEGVPAGWQVRYPENTTVTLSASESTNLTFNVTPRSSGEVTLRLVARTSVADSNDSAYAEVTIEVPREWGGLVLAGLGIVTVGAAGAVLFSQWYRGRKSGAEGVGVSGRAADGPASGGGAGSAVAGRAAEVPESARASEAPPAGKENAGEAP